MFDLRDQKVVSLDNAQELKPGAAYAFTDDITGKRLVAKLIADYEDEGDQILVSEFRKMALLSAEPQIGTVYFLAKCQHRGVFRSCYVLDFISGKTLEEMLASGQPLTVSDAESFIQEVALGLERAHAYEIVHNDLHSRNIMVDRFGNVKIIDFLWYKMSGDLSTRIKMDLDQFKAIVAKVIEKCRDEGKRRLKLVQQLCVEAQSFRGLPKKISAISEVASDLALLGQAPVQLLALLIRKLPEDFTLSMAWTEDGIPLPESVLQKHPEETTPRPQVEPFRPVPFGKIPRPPFIDTRLIALRSAVENEFRKHFRELERAGLVLVNTWVKGADANGQWPPYTYGFQISFTPKAVRWKGLLDVCDFLPQTGDLKVSDVVFPS